MSAAFFLLDPDASDFTPDACRWSTIILSSGQKPARRVGAALFVRVIFLVVFAQDIAAKIVR